MNISLRICYLTIALFATQNLTGQHNWINFSSDYSFHKIEFSNQNTWFSSNAGLTSISHETGIPKIFNMVNSGLPNNYIENIKVSEKDILWVQTNLYTGLFIDNQYKSLNNNYEGQTLIWRGVKSVDFDSNGDLITACHYNENNVANKMILRISNPDTFEIIKKLDHNLISLALDQNDAIWYGQSNGKVRVLENGQLSTFDENNSTLVDFLPVQLIVKTDEGMVIIQHLEPYDENFDGYHVSRFLGGIWEELEILLPTQNTLQHYFVGANGNLFLHFPEEEIFELVKEGWEQVIIPDISIPNPPYYNQLLNIDSKGNKWYKTQDKGQAKIIKIDEDGIQKEVEISNADFRERVREIFIDSKNNKWVLDIASVAKYDGRTWTNYSEVFNQGDFIEFIDEGPDGLIWVSYKNLSLGEFGFRKFDGGSWENFRLDSIFHENFSMSYEFHIDESNNLWMTTGKELIKYDGIDWTIEDIDYDGFILDRFIPSGDGTFYLHGGDDFYFFDGENLNDIHFPLPDWSISLKAIEDNYENLWVIRGTTIWVYDGIQFIDISQNIPDIDSLFLRSVAVDKHDIYWFGLSNGNLLRHDGIEWEIIQRPYFNHHYHKDLNVDSLNNIWISSYLDGLIVFNENGINNLGTTNGKCIEGFTYLDWNENDEQDQNEISLSNQKVKLLPDEITSISSYLGKYKFDIEDDVDKVVEYISTDDDFTTSSQSPFINVPIIDNCTENVNIGLVSTVLESRGEIEIVAGTPRCNQETRTYLFIKNTSLNPLSGVVKLDIDEKISFIDAEPSPFDIDNNLLSWEISDLAPYEQYHIEIFAKYPGVDFIGEVVFMSSQFLKDDGTVLDNDNSEQVIICSFDPNDKTGSSEGESIDNYSLLDDGIEYLIRFENKGTDTAFQVVIIDTISNDLNINSFELLASSHPVDITIRQQEIKFSFDPIFLPYSEIDPYGSQGFVKFKIDPITEIPDNTIINNKAYIYFDFNPAIVTNTTENILVDELPFDFIAEPELPINCKVSFVPNPVVDKSNLAIPSYLENGTFRLYNSMGELVLVEHQIDKRIEIQEKYFNSGIYFYSINKLSQKCIGKLIIK